MVKIRLTRMGSKRNPHYRIVVTDVRKKRSGNYIEAIGYYDPRSTVEEPLRIDAERAEYWLSQGAQPTDTVLRLFEKKEIPVGKVQAKKRRSYIARQAARANA
ncbi:MAG: 30S ribosomal protein S16 [Deinococcota bacterium]